jgi:hypothetical protein
LLHGGLGRLLALVLQFDSLEGMGVFISWSGKNSISYKVASLLRGWLPNVIQKLKPFLSSVDIDAGSQWAAEMFHALKDTQVGIICVTRANQAQPWINYEAGALAKALETSRVCPLLIDLKPADVTGPLTTLQMQTLDKDGLFSVTKVLNQYCSNEPLTNEDLRKYFDKWWSDFDVPFVEIMSSKEPSKAARRDNGEMLEEILSLVRSLDRSNRVLRIQDQLANDSFIADDLEDVARYSRSPLVKRDSRNKLIDLAEELSKVLGADLRSKLITRVGQFDIKMAALLERQKMELADGTFIVKFGKRHETVFEMLTKPPYLDALKQIALSSGHPLKLQIGERSILL